MRSTKAALVVTTLALATPAAHSQQATAHRIALIVTNSEYPGDGNRLEGPLVDGAVIRKALSGRGFTGIDGDRAPTLKRDVNRADFRDLIVRFKDAIKAAGPDAIGVCYYAGHGTAVGRESFIVPIDAPDARHADKDHVESVSWVTATLSQALKPGNPSIVVVIDACRTGLRGGSPSGDSSHLAEQRAGMLLALSAGVGESASDGGEYAKSLANAIGTRGVTIPGIFDRVKSEVWEQTQHAQIPIHTSNIVKNVCLVSCDGQQETSDPREILQRRGVLWTVDSFFNAIRRGDVETVKLFLDGHMNTDTPDSKGTSLPVILSLTTTNIDKILDLLVHSGLDLEARYEVWAPQGAHRKTLLERSVEHGNVAVAKALLARKVRVNDPMETYGPMGVTVKTYPLAASITFQHLDITRALLDAGADPRAANWAAYRESEQLSRKRPDLADTLQPLLVRLAPPAAERERQQAEHRQATVQCVKAIVDVPRDQLLDEASHFDIFSHLTLGPRECVLAEAQQGAGIG